jgi:hypothetical protein
MTRQESLRHEFVEFVPDAPAEGVLYVSLPHATAIHLCACGCGREVITPLTPTDWQLIFDGETISLRPSIGNWSFPCQSHYWLDHGRIRWAAKWSREKIEAGRARDRRNKERYAAGLPLEGESLEIEEPAAPKHAFSRFLEKIALRRNKRS